VFIDEWLSDAKNNVAWQLQSLVLPWGGDAPCTYTNGQCLTVPSGQCEDSSLPTYDMRLCRFAQLTLSQDKCYVAVGGLNVEQNTQLVTKTSDGTNNPSRFMGYSVPANSWGPGTGTNGYGYTALYPRTPSWGSSDPNARFGYSGTITNCDKSARMTVSAKIVPLNQVPNSADSVTLPYTCGSTPNAISTPPAANNWGLLAYAPATGINQGPVAGLMCVSSAFPLNSVSAPVTANPLAGGSLPTYSNTYGHFVGHTLLGTGVVPGTSIVSPCMLDASTVNAFATQLCGAPPTGTSAWAGAYVVSDPTTVSLSSIDVACPAPPSALAIFNWQLPISQRINNCYSNVDPYPTSLFPTYAFYTAKSTAKGASAFANVASSTCLTQPFFQNNDLKRVNWNGGFNRGNDATTNSGGLRTASTTNGGRYPAAEGQPAVTIAGGLNAMGAPTCASATVLTSVSLQSPCYTQLAASDTSFWGYLSSTTMAKSPLTSYAFPPYTLLKDFVYNSGSSSTATPASSPWAPVQLCPFGSLGSNGGSTAAGASTGTFALCANVPVPTTFVDRVSPLLSYAYPPTPASVATALAAPPYSVAAANSLNGGTGASTGTYPLSWAISPLSGLSTITNPGTYFQSFYGYNTLPGIDAGTGNGNSRYCFSTAASCSASITPGYSTMVLQGCNGGDTLTSVPATSSAISFGQVVLTAIAPLVFNGIATAMQVNWGATIPFEVGTAFYFTTGGGVAAPGTVLTNIGLSLTQKYYVLTKSGSSISSSFTFSTSPNGAPFYGTGQPVLSPTIGSTLSIIIANYLQCGNTIGLPDISLPQRLFAGMHFQAQAYTITSIGVNSLIPQSTKTYVIASQQGSFVGLDGIYYIQEVVGGSAIVTTAAVAGPPASGRPTLFIPNIFSTYLTLNPTMVDTALDSFAATATSTNQVTVNPGQFTTCAVGNTVSGPGILGLPVITAIAPAAKSASFTSTAVDPNTKATLTPVVQNTASPVTALTALTGFFTPCKVEPCTYYFNSEASTSTGATGSTLKNLDLLKALPVGAILLASQTSTLGPVYLPASGNNTLTVFENTGSAITFTGATINSLTAAVASNAVSGTAVDNQISIAGFAPVAGTAFYFTSLPTYVAIPSSTNFGSKLFSSTSNPTGTIVIGTVYYVLTAAAATAGSAFTFTTSPTSTSPVLFSNAGGAALLGASAAVLNLGGAVSGTVVDSQISISTFTPVAGASFHFTSLPTYIGNIAFGVAGYNTFPTKVFASTNVNGLKVGTVYYVHTAAGTTQGSAFTFGTSTAATSQVVFTSSGAVSLSATVSTTTSFTFNSYVFNYGAPVPATLTTGVFFHISTSNSAFTAMPTQLYKVISAFATPAAATIHTACANPATSFVFQRADGGVISTLPASGSTVTITIADLSSRGKTLQSSFFGYVTPSMKYYGDTVSGSALGVTSVNSITPVVTSRVVSSSTASTLTVTAASNTACPLGACQGTVYENANIYLPGTQYTVDSTTSGVTTASSTYFPTIASFTASTAAGYTGLGYTGTYQITDQPTTLPLTTGMAKYPGTPASQLAAAGTTQVDGSTHCSINSQVLTNTIRKTASTTSILKSTAPGVFTWTVAGTTSTDLVGLAVGSKISFPVNALTGLSQCSSTSTSNCNSYVVRSLSYAAPTATFSVDIASSGTSWNTGNLATVSCTNVGAAGVKDSQGFFVSSTSMFTATCTSTTSKGFTLSSSTSLAWGAGAVSVKIYASTATEPLDLLNNKLDLTNANNAACFTAAGASVNSCSASLGTSATCCFIVGATTIAIPAAGSVATTILTSDSLPDTVLEYTPVQTSTFTSYNTLGFVPATAALSGVSTISWGSATPPGLVVGSPFRFVAPMTTSYSATGTGVANSVTLSSTVPLSVGDVFSCAALQAANVFVSSILSTTVSLGGVTTYDITLADFSSAAYATVATAAVGYTLKPIYLAAAFSSTNYITSLPTPTSFSYTTSLRLASSTLTALTSTVTTTSAHNLVAGSTFVFTGLGSGYSWTTPVSTSTTYYVQSIPTSTTFTFSTSANVATAAYTFTSTATATGPTIAVIPVAANFASQALSIQYTTSGVYPITSPTTASSYTLVANAFSSTIVASTTNHPFASSSNSFVFTNISYPGAAPTYTQPVYSTYALASPSYVSTVPAIGVTYYYVTPTTPAYPGNYNGPNVALQCVSTPALCAAAATATTFSFSATPGGTPITMPIFSSATILNTGIKGQGFYPASSSCYGTNPSSSTSSLPAGLPLAVSTFNSSSALTCIASSGVLTSTLQLPARCLTLFGTSAACYTMASDTSTADLTYASCPAASTTVSFAAPQQLFADSAQTGSGSSGSTTYAGGLGGGSLTLATTSSYTYTTVPSTAILPFPSFATVPITYPVYPAVLPHSTANPTTAFLTTVITTSSAHGFTVGDSFYFSVPPTFSTPAVQTSYSTQNSLLYRGNFPSLPGTEPFYTLAQNLNTNDANDAQYLFSRYSFFSGDLTAATFTGRSLSQLAAAAITSTTQLYVLTTPTANTFTFGTTAPTATFCVPPISFVSGSFSNVPTIVGSTKSLPISTSAMGVTANYTCAGSSSTMTGWIDITSTQSLAQVRFYSGQPVVGATITGACIPANTYITAVSATTQQNGYQIATLSTVVTAASVGLPASPWPPTSGVPSCGTQGNPLQFTLTGASTQPLGYGLYHPQYTLTAGGANVVPTASYLRSVNLESVPRAVAYGFAINRVSVPTTPQPTLFYATGDSIYSADADAKLHGLYGARYLGDNQSPFFTYGDSYAPYYAKGLDAGNSQIAGSDYGVQSLCFAMGTTVFAQHLLSVYPATGSVVRYWGDTSTSGSLGVTGSSINERANVPGIYYASQPSTVSCNPTAQYSTTLYTGSTCNQGYATSSPISASYGSDTTGAGTAASNAGRNLGGCASFMSSQVTTSNGNAVFWAEYSSTAAVKRGMFANSWLVSASIWRPAVNMPSGVTDNNVLALAFTPVGVTGSSSTALYAVTPTRLFMSTNPLENFDTNVAWTLLNALGGYRTAPFTLSSSFVNPLSGADNLCTDTDCSTASNANKQVKYEYRGVVISPLHDPSCAKPYMSSSQAPTATSSSSVSTSPSTSPTLSVTVSGTVTASISSTVSVSSSATTTGSRSASATTSFSVTTSGSATVSVTVSASATPSLIPIPYSYDSGNVVLSRVERLNADLSATTCGLGNNGIANWGQQLHNANGAGLPGTSTICNNPSELARVWVDEINWPVATSATSSSCWVKSCSGSPAGAATFIAALDNPTLAFGATRVQSMHFPHRWTSIDTYRLVLPYDASDSLGLGQLSSSSDRCAVTIAGLDMPYYDGTDIHKQFANTSYANAASTDTACSAISTTTFSGTSKVLTNYITDIVSRIKGSDRTNYASRPNPCPVGSSVDGPGVPHGTYVTRVTASTGSNCVADSGAGTGGSGCYMLYLSNIVTSSTATTSCAQCFTCSSPITNFRASFDVTVPGTLNALTGDMPFLGMPVNAAATYGTSITGPTSTPELAYYITGPGIYPGTRVSTVLPYASGKAVMALETNEVTSALFTSVNSSVFSAYSAAQPCSTAGFALTTTAVASTTPVFTSAVTHSMAAGSSFTIPTFSAGTLTAGYTGIAPTTTYYVVAAPTSTTFYASKSSTVSAFTITSTASVNPTATSSSAHSLYPGDWFMFEGGAPSGLPLTTAFYVCAVTSSTAFTFATTAACAASTTTISIIVAGVSITPLVSFTRSVGAIATVVPSCTAFSSDNLAVNGIAATVGVQVAAVSTTTQHGLSIGSYLTFPAAATNTLVNTLYTVTAVYSRFTFSFALATDTSSTAIYLGVNSNVQTYIKAFFGSGVVPTYFNTLPLTTVNSVSVLHNGGNEIIGNPNPIANPGIYPWGYSVLAPTAPWTIATATSLVLDNSFSYFLATGLSVTPCATGQCSPVTLTYKQGSTHQGNAGLSNMGAANSNQMYPIGSTSAYQAGVGAVAARYPYAASCAVQYKNYGAFATRQNINPNPLVSSTLGQMAVLGDTLPYAYVTPAYSTASGAAALSSYGTAATTTAAGAADPNVLTTSSLLISTSAAGVSTVQSVHKTSTAATHVAGLTGVTGVTAAPAWENDNLAFYDYIEQESSVTPGSCASGLTVTPTTAQLGNPARSTGFANNGAFVAFNAANSEGTDTAAPSFVSNTGVTLTVAANGVGGSFVLPGIGLTSSTKLLSSAPVISGSFISATTFNYTAGSAAACMCVGAQVKELSASAGGLPPASVKVSSIAADAAGVAPASIPPASANAVINVAMPSSTATFTFGQPFNLYGLIQTISPVAVTAPTGAYTIATASWVPSVGSTFIFTSVTAASPVVNTIYYVLTVSAVAAPVSFTFGTAHPNSGTTLANAGQTAVSAALITAGMKIAPVDYISEWNQYATTSAPTGADYSYYVTSDVTTAATVTAFAAGPPYTRSYTIASQDPGSAALPCSATPVGGVSIACVPFSSLFLLGSGPTGSSPNTATGVSFPYVTPALAKTPLSIANVAYTQTTGNPLAPTLLSYTLSGSVYSPTFWTALSAPSTTSNLIVGGACSSIPTVNPLGSTNNCVLKNVLYEMMTYAKATSSAFTYTRSDTELYNDFLVGSHFYTADGFTANWLPASNFAPSKWNVAFGCTQSSDASAASTCQTPKFGITAATLTAAGRSTVAGLAAAGAGLSGCTGSNGAGCSRPVVAFTQAGTTAATSAVAVLGMGPSNDASFTTPLAGAYTGSATALANGASSTVLALNGAHGASAGKAFYFSGSAPVGLSTYTPYYVLTTPATTTLTFAANIGGAALSMVSVGAGVNVHFGGFFTGLVSATAAPVVYTLTPSGPLSSAFLPLGTSVTFNPAVSAVYFTATTSIIYIDGFTPIVGAPFFFIGTTTNGVVASASSAATSPTIYYVRALNTSATCATCFSFGAANGLTPIDVQAFPSWTAVIGHSPQFSALVTAVTGSASATSFTVATPVPAFTVSDFTTGVYTISISSSSSAVTSTASGFTTLTTSTAASFAPGTVLTAGPAALTANNALTNTAGIANTVMSMYLTCLYASTTSASCFSSASGSSTVVSSCSTANFIAITGYTPVVNAVISFTSGVAAIPAAAANTAYYVTATTTCGGSTGFSFSSTVGGTAIAVTANSVLTNLAVIYSSTATTAGFTLPANTPLAASTSLTNSPSFPLYATAACSSTSSAAATCSLSGMPLSSATAFFYLYVLPAPISCGSANSATSLYCGTSTSSLALPAGALIKSPNGFSYNLNSATSVFPANSVSLYALSTTILAVPTSYTTYMQIAGWTPSVGASFTISSGSITMCTSAISYTVAAGWYCPPLLGASTYQTTQNTVYTVRTLASADYVGGPSGYFTFSGAGISAAGPSIAMFINVQTATLTTYAPGATATPASSGTVTATTTTTPPTITIAGFSPVVGFTFSFTSVAGCTSCPVSVGTTYVVQSATGSAFTFGTSLNAGNVAATASLSNLAAAPIVPATSTSAVTVVSAGVGVNGYAASTTFLGAVTATGTAAVISISGFTPVVGATFYFSSGAVSGTTALNVLYTVASLVTPSTFTFAPVSSPATLATLTGLTLPGTLVAVLAQSPAFSPVTFNGASISNTISIVGWTPVYGAAISFSGSVPAAVSTSAVYFVSYASGSNFAISVGSPTGTAVTFSAFAGFATVVALPGSINIPATLPSPATAMTAQSFTYSPVWSSFSAGATTSTLPTASTFSLSLPQTIASSTTLVPNYYSSGFNHYNGYVSNTGVGSQLSIKSNANAASTVYTVAASGRQTCTATGTLTPVTTTTATALSGYVTAGVLYVTSLPSLSQSIDFGLAVGQTVKSGDYYGTVTAVTNVYPAGNLGVYATYQLSNAASVPQLGAIGTLTATAAADTVSMAGFTPTMGAAFSFTGVGGGLVTSAVVNTLYYVSSLETGTSFKFRNAAGTQMTVTAASGSTTAASVTYYPTFTVTSQSYHFTPSSSLNCGSANGNGAYAALFTEIPIGMPISISGSSCGSTLFAAQGLSSQSSVASTNAAVAGKAAWTALSTTYMLSTYNQLDTGRYAPWTCTATAGTVTIVVGTDQSASALNAIAAGGAGVFSVDTAVPSSVYPAISYSNTYMGLYMSAGTYTAGVPSTGAPATSFTVTTAGASALMANGCSTSPAGCFLTGMSVVTAAGTIPTTATAWTVTPLTSYNVAGSSYVINGLNNLRPLGHQSITALPALTLAAIPSSINLLSFASLAGQSASVAISETFGPATGSTCAIHVRAFSCPFPGVATFNITGTLDFTASLLNSKFDATYVSSDSASTTLRLDSLNNYNYVVPAAGMRLSGPGAGYNSYITAVTVTSTATYYLPPTYTITVQPALSAAARGVYTSIASASAGLTRGGGDMTDPAAARWAGNRPNGTGVFKWAYYNSYALTGGCLAAGYASQKSFLLASAQTTTAIPPQNTLLQNPPTSVYANSVNNLGATTMPVGAMPDSVTPVSWGASLYGFLAQKDGSTACATSEECYLYTTTSQGTLLAARTPTYITGALSVGMALSGYTIGGTTNTRNNLMGGAAGLGATTGVPATDPYYTTANSARADNANMVYVASYTTTNGAGGTTVDATCGSVCVPFLLKGFAASTTTSYIAPYFSSTSSANLGVSKLTTYAPSSTSSGVSTSLTNPSLWTDCSYARATQNLLPCTFFFSGVTPSTTTRAGYPISVARIGGAGWRDVYTDPSLQHYGQPAQYIGQYPQAFSAWMNTKFLSSAPCALTTYGTGGCAALNSQPNTGFKAKEFLVQSWEDIPKSVAFTTEKLLTVTQSSPHMSQVFMATGRKACNSTTIGCPSFSNGGAVSMNTAGSVIGRCWYGEAGASPLNLAPVAPLCQDSLWTTVDPTNTFGTTGLCYTSASSNDVEGHFLQMRPTQTGALYTWPQYAYKPTQVTDQMYIPVLDNGYSASCQATSDTPSRTFSGSTSSNNVNCLNSIYNPNNPNYVGNALYGVYSVDLTNGFPGTSSTGVPSNFRNCAARTASAETSLSLVLAVPSFTFWIERSASNGFAVQRGDFESGATTVSGSWTAPKPIWYDSNPAATYGRAAVTTSSAGATPLAQDNALVGVAYYASSVSSGMLFVASTTALYGSYNPLAPYYVDYRLTGSTTDNIFKQKASNYPAATYPTRSYDCTTTPPATGDAVSNPLCFVQWHKLVQLGNGMSGYNAQTGNLGFATNPSLTPDIGGNQKSVNAFRGIALAPRACTYGYATSQLGFRELEGSAAEEGASAAAEEELEKEAA